MNIYKNLLFIVVSSFVLSCNESDVDDYYVNLQDEYGCEGTLTTNEPIDIVDTLGTVSFTMSGTINIDNCSPWYHGIRWHSDSSRTSASWPWTDVPLPRDSIQLRLSGRRKNQTFYYKTFFYNNYYNFEGNEITFTPQ